MARHRHQDSSTTLVGPGLEGWAGRESEPLEPEVGDPPQIAGRKLFLRLVIAFFLVVAISIVCFVVLPMAGIPPWVPLAAFVVIAIAVLTNARAEGELPEREREEEPGGCDCEGRPVGCCPGPRPPRFLADDRRRR